MWLGGKEGVDDDLMDDWLMAVIKAGRRGITGEKLATALTELVDHLSSGQRAVVRRHALVAGATKTAAAIDFRISVTGSDGCEIVFSHWPEGYALERHGKIVWREDLPEMVGEDVSLSDLVHELDEIIGSDEESLRRREFLMKAIRLRKAELRAAVSQTGEAE